MENLIRIDDDFQKRKRNRMNKGIFTTAGEILKEKNGNK